jgi:hypothetical protein
MPTIRAATEGEIKGIASRFRLLSAQCDWSDPFYSPTKAAALSLVAELAYCDASQDDLDNHERAKYFPCALYQRIIAMGAVLDIGALLGETDIFQLPFVVRVGASVALILKLGSIIFIGVRGSQYDEDWRTNRRFRLSKKSRFHTGFLEEAYKLSHAIQDELEMRKQSSPGDTFCVTGHSLGGAVAAILSVLPCSSFMRLLPSCVFGSPRVGGKVAVRNIPFVTAVSRKLDPVPLLPPRIFGYADYYDHRFPSGAPYVKPKTSERSIRPWQPRGSWKRIVGEHMIERYIEDLFFEAGRIEAATRF